MSAQGGAGIAVAVVFFGAIATYWVAAIRSGARHERAVLKEHRRAARAHYAAVEAAEDEPSFSPDAIERSVAEIVGLADDLWRAGMSRGLDGRPDAGLVRAWARSVQSWFGSGLEVTAKPSIDLLSVVNRHDEEEDRVVARVRLRLHCKHPRLGTVYHAHLDERWTFGRCGSWWGLLAVGGDPLAGPILTAPLIPTPSSDTERLSEESLAELASAQKVGKDVDLSGLVNADEPPAFALPDLSLVDGRFLPALIAAQLGHLLEAWESAVTGSEVPFEEVASADARAALLRPGRGGRLIVQDAVLKAWEPTKLDLSRHPPAIEVTLDLEAVRFVVAADGSHVAGNQTDVRRMTLEWTLVLTDAAQTPWRLTASNNPAEAIPGWP